MPRTVKMGGNLVGHTLGMRYKVDQRIGAGGFAIVYRAKDTRINKYVAIKVLDRDKIRNLRDIGRFRNEAAIAAVVDDDHIVKVTDYGEEDGLFYVVMELLRGHSLRQILLMNERMPWQRACKICIQVCAALEAAHSHGVIHRDVKPENIFLENRRSGEHVKLLDLGIAKVLNDDQWEGLAQNLSMSGDFVGSPSYVAPEQAKGPNSCDFRGDLYALGIVLYELVTGDVPFRGESAWETVLMHVERAPSPPSEKAPRLKIPAAYDAVVMRALSKDPNKRYRNAAEMAAALREVLEAGPPMTAEDERAAREGGFVEGGSAESGPAEQANVVLAPTEAAEIDTNKLPQRADRRGAAVPSEASQGSSVEPLGSAPTQRQVTPATAPVEPPASAVEAPAVKLPPTVAFKQTEPLPSTVSSSPSSIPLESARHYPMIIPPLRWRSRIYVAYLLCGSLMATCTISTALALTLDPDYLDHLAERNHVKVIKRPDLDDFYNRPLNPPPKPAPAPTPAHESPFDRLVRAPADPDEVVADEAPARKVVRPPTKPRPAAEEDSPPVEAPGKGPSMAAKARQAAAAIKDYCRITPFSPLVEAKYDVVFHVDTATGAIQQVVTSGEPPPLKLPDCVRDRALGVVKTFAGARDLKAEYRHTYTVVR